MKIYTRTGDQGETSLYAGKRLSKADNRVQAYGDVDELQAQLGLVMAQLDKKDELKDLLEEIQYDGFVICSELARLKKVKPTDPELQEERVVWLEQQIDHHDSKLPILHSFILQGGSLIGAGLHVSRAVCRRAERSVVALSHTEVVSPVVLRYLNRLSDLLFVLARYTNHQVNTSEKTWKWPK